MRLIAYVFFVYISLWIAWQLGMAGHGSAGNLLIFAVLMGGACCFITRRLCFVLGAIGLMLSIVGPLTVWTWGTIFVKGDPSGYGMLGTLLAFVFMPIGLGLVLVGWFKNK